MALPSKDEISLAWRALNGKTDGAGWRSIPLFINGSVRLQAARRFPENEEALLIGFVSVPCPADVTLPQGRGFKVMPAELGDENYNWIALVRQTQGALELFTMMSADIASTLVSSHCCEEVKLFHLFLGRIRAWQSFMAKGLDGLAPEAELGLIGELTCIEKLLDAGLPGYAVVESWVGPLDGVQDFEIGSGAIEVKSTLASCGFPASIHSLEQLDDSVRSPLFVCGCRYKISENGLTLPERVRRLRGRFENDDVASLVFASSLLHVGFLNDHVERYSRRFVDVEIMHLLVNESFPRLIIGNVPSGVRSARYEIDLDRVETKKYSIDEVINLLGGI